MTQECIHSSSRKCFVRRCELFASLLLLTPGAIGDAAFGSPPIIIKLPANATSVEIQMALDRLPPNGELVLAPGTYEISRPLMLRHDYQTLRGIPARLHHPLHLSNGADCAPVMILGPPMTETRAPRSTHLFVADLLIDGNRKNQKREFWKSAGDGCEFNNNGVQIWNVTDAAVEHVTCCRCRSGGMVTAGVRRIQVKDFDSYDNQFDGLACYQTEESHFGSLRLHDNLAAGISLDLDFNHNFITDAVLAGNDLGIFMRDSRNNSFQGLTISKSRHDGVFMAQAVAPTPKGWRTCPGTECVGNNFENLMVHDCGGNAFRVNDATCTNNVISGALFLHNIRGGLGQPATNPVSCREVADR